MMLCWLLLFFYELQFALSDAWIIPNATNVRRARLQYQSSSSPSALFSSLEAEAQRLKEQARKLREEIESFQQEKDDMKKEERQLIQAELDEKQALVDRYSAVVPILKPDGLTVEEKVQFPPRLEKDKNSIITVCEAALPLGIILGESETLRGATVVDEVIEKSNGAAAGIQVGDLVRGFTACRMEMDQPSWQLIVGGIGRPKTMRFMYGSDFKPFEEVMEAVGSNRMDPEGRKIVLVIERPQLFSLPLLVVVRF
jgi:hypothetical protein